MTKKNLPPTQEEIQGPEPRNQFCPRCQRPFATVKLLSEHLDRSHPDYENPFTTE